MIVKIEIDGDSVPAKYLLNDFYRFMKFNYDYMRNVTIIDVDKADDFGLYEGESCVYSKHAGEDLRVNEAIKITVAETEFFLNLFNVRLDIDGTTSEYKYSNVNKVVACLQDDGTYDVELFCYHKEPNGVYSAGPHLVFDNVTCIETNPACL